MGFFYSCGAFEIINISLEINQVIIQVLTTIENKIRRLGVYVQGTHSICKMKFPDKSRFSKTISQKIQVKITWLFRWNLVSEILVGLRCEKKYQSENTVSGLKWKFPGLIQHSLTSNEISWPFPDFFTIPWQFQVLKVLQVSKWVCILTFFPRAGSSWLLEPGCTYAYLWSEVSRFQMCIFGVDKITLGLKF